MNVSEFQISPVVLPVPELKGYRDGVPLCGDIIAFYHPYSSLLITINNVGLQILDLIHNPDSSARISPTLLKRGLQELSQLSIIHPKNSKEPPPTFASSPRTTEYISLTEACNFGCENCAVDVGQNRGRPSKTMTTEDVERTLLGTVQSAKNRNQKEVQIKWAGGEPTLPKPWNLLLNAQKILTEIKNGNPDIRIEQMILTNGSKITPEIAKILSDLGIHVSVSLYALGLKNQELRGAPSHALTPEQALQNLSDANASFSVNHVIGPHNAENLRTIIEFLWDRESPIPLSIAFLRAKTEHLAFHNSQNGIGPMISGIRQGFDSIRALIANSKQIPPLSRIDYLSPFQLTRAACGTGFNYFAAGPRGVTSCHEKTLYLNSHIPPNADLQTLANADHPDTNNLLGPNKNWSGIHDPRIQAALMYHGGAGCPRLALREGKQANEPASTSQIYAKILLEFLSLEASRRLRFN